MAINQNHTFEELNGIKCGIVEKNVSKQRVEFIRQLLELNKFEVIVVPSPPPKSAAPAENTENAIPLPETFTVGVTDITFNTINAIWGRLLKNKDGLVVTQRYWQQLN